MRALNLLAVVMGFVMVALSGSAVVTAADHRDREAVVDQESCSVCGMAHKAGHCIGRAAVGTGRLVTGTVTDGGATVFEIVGDGVGFVENGANRVRNFFYRTGRRVRVVFDCRR